MTEPYKATITVASQIIADQVVTAIEGGINYWCKSAYLISSENKPDDTIWYAEPKLYEGDFVIEFTLHEPHDGEQTVYRLTPEAVRKGLAVLSSNPDRSFRIAQIVDEMGDAETADVFIQACLFGDIIYG
jgi:hypothetical protein